MASIKDVLREGIKAIVGDALLMDVPLARYTSFGLGGPCSFFVTVSSEQQLSDLMGFISENELDYFILGNGTNILVSDRGYDGVVIRLGGSFGEYRFVDDGVWAGAGCNIWSIIESAAEHGFSGIEALAGIPGSIGGALKMNASAYGVSIGSFVDHFVAIDENGRTVIFSPSNEDWAYRSGPVCGLVVSSVLLHLSRDNPQKVMERAREYIERRKKTQPLGERSAGCVFKNPSEDLPAALLIDRLGLKGTRIGGARVSEKHANFIVVDEGATASQVYKLMKKIMRVVLDQTGIELEPEIILLGEFENE